MTSRLDSISNELAELVRRADEVARRRAALAACERALEQVDIMEQPHVRLAATALRGGELSDMARADLLRRLTALQAELDDVYLTMQEQEGENDTAYLSKFAQARVVAALTFALRNEAHEAIYEACAAALDHRDDVIAAARSALAA